MRKSEQKFSFWPSDWIGGTSSLSPAERGVYIDLLAEQWQRGPLDEAQALAAGRADAEIVRQVLAKKFHQNPDGRWQNNRLEQERQRRRPKRAADRAEVTPAGPPADLATPLMIFPCRGEPRSWGLYPAQVRAWEALYPGLDVRAECQKALAWVEANGGKTANGMLRFLVNWLNRATDKGRAGKAADQKSFRQKDADERRRMVTKLKLEQAGLDRATAERLANLDEQSAMTEAQRILSKMQPKLIEEEIPW